MNGSMTVLRTCRDETYLSCINTARQKDIDYSTSPGFHIGSTTSVYNL